MRATKIVRLCSVCSLLQQAVGEANEDVTYTVVKGGSSHRRDILIDSRGYIYCSRPSRPSRKAPDNKTNWRCSVRSKKCMCFATVVGVDDHYEPGSIGHNHLPKPDKAARCQIAAKVCRQEWQLIIILA